MAIYKGNLLVAGAGNPGQSAYDYALQGGYTGTKEEFAKKLSQDVPQDKINEAVTTEVSKLKDTLGKYISATNNDLTGDYTPSLAEYKNINFNGNHKIYVDQNIIFNNCIFNGCYIEIVQNRNVSFYNCTFINNIFTSVKLLGSNVNVNIDNCIFKDNKPPKEEWNANEGSVRNWKYAPISVYANNSALTVTHSKFENILAGQCIYVPPKYDNTVYDKNILIIRENQFRNTAYAAIVCYSTIYGDVSYNKIENIGALIHNVDGYSFPTENSAVGANGMYIINSPEVDIIGNYIHNVCETGIEGQFNIIRDNVIVNTGYRKDEGITTPSYDGIYNTRARVIKNNIIENCVTNGITFFGNDVVCSENVVKNCNVGVYYIIEDGNNENVSVTRNNIEYCTSQFEVLNLNSVIAKNFSLEISNSLNMMKDVYDRLNGVNVYSRNEHILNKNIYFKEIENGNLTDWVANNGVVTQVTDNGNLVGKLKSNDIYGTISQNYFQLPTGRHSIICVSISYKTTCSDCSISIECVDDNGKMYPTDGGVYTIYKLPIPAHENYEIHHLALKAIGKTKIRLHVSKANEEIYVEEFKITAIN